MDLPICKKNNIFLFTLHWQARSYKELLGRAYASLPTRVNEFLVTKRLKGTSDTIQSNYCNNDPNILQSNTGKILYGPHIIISKSQALPVVPLEDKIMFEDEKLSIKCCLFPVLSY